MRTYTIFLFLALFSCGKESSPEGRMQIKYAQLEQKVDSLADQNRAIQDSLVVISRELKALQSR